MKRINVLVALSLLASFVVSGCQTTDYVYVTPECTPPAQPVLPSVDMGSTWEKLGDADYRQLERYINGLWAFSDEQGTMLDELCTGDDEAL